MTYTHMGFNLDWLFNDEEKKLKESNDQKKDPLNLKGFRDDDTSPGHKKELDIDYFESVTEDEKRIFENDPEVKNSHKLFDDFNAKSTFYGLDENLLDEISNEEAYDYGDLSATEFSAGRDAKEEERHDLDYDNAPFEERDIMAERISQYKQRKEKETKKEERDLGLPYSLTDFRLMEDAYKFKTLVKKETQNLLEKNKPISKETRQPITESELKNILKKYYSIKDKRNWSDYKADELNFMKKCSFWNRLNGEAEQKQKAPVMLDGQILTEKQIEELMKEYSDLRKDNPRDFAELKVADNQWEKGDFVWKSDEYNGKKQYCYFDKKNNFTTKYILKNPPEGFTPGKAKNTYYTMDDGSRRINAKFGIVNVILKPPYTFEDVNGKIASSA